MRAIFTKFIPATNTRAAKIKAWAEGVKPLTVSVDYDYDGAARFAVAAVALCKREGWTHLGNLVSGGHPDESGEVFCFANSETFEVTA